MLGQGARSALPGQQQPSLRWFLGQVPAPGDGPALGEGEGISEVRINSSPFYPGLTPRTQTASESPRYTWHIPPPALHLGCTFTGNTLPPQGWARKVQAHTEALEAGWALCCSPALTMRAHSLAGTLATWAEQVMADECNGARYGAGTTGQPGICRSSTTSSSSSSTARAWGSSNSVGQGQGEEHGHRQCQVQGGGRQHTILWSHAVHREEVNDAGGEVQCHQSVRPEHTHTVAVTIAGTGHAAAKDDEVAPIQGWGL